MPSASQSSTPLAMSDSNDKSQSSIVVQNSLGLKLLDGAPNFSGNATFENVEEKVKYITISENGKRIAWIANGIVRVIEAPEWIRIGSLQHPKASEIVFSPNGSYLAVRDIYSQPQGAPPVPNLSIYDVSGRKLLKSFVQKNHEGWQPQWTKDESIMARKVSNDVHFYEDNNLEKYKYKKHFEKLNSFSLSPSVGQHHATFFVPSIKSSPCIVQLYKYPNLMENSSVIASKSFFKVETVESFWNRYCTGVLLLTTAAVDKSGASYYGEQMLFLLSTRGDSIRVTFSKQGNIRSVAWCPSGKEFFCVYGLAPAKATVFNLKCDAISEFGEGARNLVLVNPQGNLALIGGMGNISSRFEIWDIKEEKKLGDQECPDITQMEWSPCGQYILTATCSPRLRVNNGFKIWHYSTSLLYENMCSDTEELYQASWLPSSTPPAPFEISSEEVKGIQSGVKKASTQRYVPPSQRLAASTTGRDVATSKKFLSQLDDPPPKEQDPKEQQKEKQKQKRIEKRGEVKKKKEELRGMDKDWREARYEKETNQDEKDATKQDASVKVKKDHSSKKKKNIKKKQESSEKSKDEKEAITILAEDQLKKIKNDEAVGEELNKVEGLSVS